MVRRAAAAALIACEFAFFAAPGTAAEQQHNYVKVHLHLNAYAHWGYCSGGGYKPPPVTYKTFSATCTGTRGAEIGTLRDEPFLTHGNFCVWDWQGDHLYLRGTDSHGGEWVLNGLKDPKWTHFKVTSGQILPPARRHRRRPPRVQLPRDGGVPALGRPVPPHVLEQREPRLRVLDRPRRLRARAVADEAERGTKPRPRGLRSARGGAGRRSRAGEPARG